MCISRNHLALVVVLGSTLTAGTLRAGDKDPEIATAWGKPVEGMQAGIRVKPGKPPGDTVVELQVVVRNVGKKKLEFRHTFAMYFWGECDGGVVSVQEAYIYGGFFPPGLFVYPTLAPEDEMDLGSMIIERSVADEKPNPPGLGVGLNTLKRTRLKPGKYQVGIDHLKVLLTGGNPLEIPRMEGKPLELGTGYLDITIPAEQD